MLSHVTGSHACTGPTHPNSHSTHTAPVACKNRLTAAAGTWIKGISILCQLQRAAYQQVHTANEKESRNSMHTSLTIASQPCTLVLWGADGCMCICIDLYRAVQTHHSSHACLLHIRLPAVLCCCHNGAACPSLRQFCQRQQVMLNSRAPEQPGEPCQAGTDLPQAITDLIP